MNDVVHHHEPATWGSVVCVAVPHVQQDSDVMVPVQENQRLFAQNDEDSIPELINFGQSEQTGPEAGYALKVGGNTYRVLQAVLSNSSYQFRQRSDGASDAKDCLLYTSDAADMPDV